MKQTLSILFFLTLIIACKTNKPRTYHKCPIIPSDGYAYVQEDKFASKNDNNELTYINELKYYCVTSAMLSKKILFDKFGKWNYGIFPESNKNPVLFWEKTKIFDNDTSTYTIAAYGKEEIGYIYTSFMVLDNEGNDVLVNPVKLRQFRSKLGGFLRKNDRKNKAFYETYWKSLNVEN